MKRHAKRFIEKNKGLLIVIVLFVGLNGLAFGIYTTQSLKAQYGPEIFFDIDKFDERPVALVFGGGMESETQMSTMQQDRVQAAIDLYNAQKIMTLVMTGDDGQNRFNEVEAMRDFAIANGVPAEDVLIDWHGYRTYESCWRAARVLDLESVIAVSQEFHLYRILYMCQSQGIDTIGYAADRREYKGYGSGLREVLARVKGWWQIEVTGPKPRVIE